MTGVLLGYSHERTSILVTPWELSVRPPRRSTGISLLAAIRRERKFLPPILTWSPRTSVRPSHMPRGGFRRQSSRCREDSSGHESFTELGSVPRVSGFRMCSLELSRGCPSARRRGDAVGSRRPSALMSCVFYVFEMMLSAPERSLRSTRRAPASACFQLDPVTSPPSTSQRGGWHSGSPS